MSFLPFIVFQLLMVGVHHCIAHPLLFITRCAGWALRFHDATARRAWPRPHFTPDDFGPPLADSPDYGPDVTVSPDGRIVFLDAIDPTARAGSLSVVELNGYVRHELARLDALGFSREDVVVDIPLDASQVGAAVMVRAPSKSFMFVSHVVVGRNADGSGIRRAT